MIGNLKSSPLRASKRRGAVLPLVAALAVVLIGMLAFSIDLGYISLVRGQMQSAADAAALASASQLFDRDLLSGGTTQSLTNADAQAAKFAAANAAGGVSLTIASSDVQYGYIADPRDPASPFDTTRTPYNSAKVKVQRTTARNGELGLFFARIFNQGSLPLEATATATYEGGVTGFKFNSNYSNQRCTLLPFTLDYDIWDKACAGLGPDAWTHNSKAPYGVTAGADTVHEMKLYPTKNMTPGNFGTWDIGSGNNSSSDIERQILYGPNKADLDLMGGDVKLGSDGKLKVSGDTGISAGFKDALLAIKGQPRTIALHEKVVGNGDNSQYTLVRFVGCTILDVRLDTTNKYITIQPCHTVDPTAQGGGSGSSSNFVYTPLRLTR
ncbi:MAG: pilus assembly protein TadG-related protein [Planctomycetota bacterium]|nr:pilus assembly protein TadG-related protein [Planctomycetota bacterium]